MGAANDYADTLQALVGPDVFYWPKPKYLFIDCLDFPDYGLSLKDLTTLLA